MSVRSKIEHLKKVKNVKWLVPGWVFFEFYNVHKKKGLNKKKSFGHGVKAEVIRLAAFASIPVPGTYELTTTGLALLKKRIESGEIEKVTLKAFKDFIPLRRFQRTNNSGRPYIRIFFMDKKLHFEIFYKEKR